MIPETKCMFKGCKSELKELEEFDNGICARHKNQFESSKHFTLACWHCGSLLDTIHRREAIRGAIIKSDYIFTKECPYCNKECKFDRLQFVTTNESVGPESTVITSSWAQESLFESKAVIA